MKTAKKGANSAPQAFNHSPQLLKELYRFHLFSILLDKLKSFIFAFAVSNSILNYISHNKQ